MDYNTVLGYLNKEGVYQTEFGVKGKGLTELEKDTLEEILEHIKSIDEKLS